MFNCTRFDAPSMLATDPLLSPLWYTLLCATHQSASTKHVHSLKAASYIHSSTFALIRRCIQSMNAVRAHCGARHQSIVTSMQPLWGIIIWSMSIYTQSRTMQNSHVTHHASMHNNVTQPQSAVPVLSPSVHSALTPEVQPQTSALVLSPSALSRKCYLRPQPQSSAPAFTAP